MIDNEYIQHYGKLGMHWGRRNGTSRLSSLGIKKKLPTINDHSKDSADYTKKVELKKKKMNQLTNTELQTLNTRLQLERSYKDLSKADLSPGKKFVTETITKFGKDIATDMITKGLNNSLDTVVSKGITIGLNAAMNQGLKKAMK